MFTYRRVFIVSVLQHILRFANFAELLLTHTFSQDEHRNKFFERLESMNTQFAQRSAEVTR